MNFTARNKRSGGDAEERGFQQMHDSIESLDFLDLEGLEEYAGGEKAKKSSNPPADKPKANQRLVPLSLSPGKTVADTLAMADKFTSSHNKTKVSPPSLDGGTRQSHKSRRGGKREEFQRAQSEKIPSSSPMKHRSPTPARSRSAEQSSAVTSPVVEQAPKTPKPQNRIMAALRRNHSQESDDTKPPPFFQQMNDSVESLDFVDLQALEEDAGGKKNQEKPSSSTQDTGAEKTGTLAALRQSVVNTLTFSPRKKTSSVVKQGMDDVPRLDSLESPKATKESKQKPSSPKKEQSKRSMTPFRRARNEDSLADEAPKTPKTQKSMFRSITPFRREPGTEDEDNGSPPTKTPTKQRLSLSPFKRAKSQKKMEDDPLVQSPNPKDIERSSSGQASSRKERPNTPRMVRNKPESELKPEVVPSRHSSKKPRPTTPYRRDRNDQDLSPSKSATEKPGPCLEIFVKTDSPRKSKSSRSLTSRKSRKSVDASAQSRKSATTKKTSSQSSKKTPEVESPTNAPTTERQRARSTNRADDKETNADDQPKRRRTKTPMRRRPQPIKVEDLKKEENSPKQQDDDSSTFSSTSDSSNSGRDGSSANNTESKEFVRSAVRSLERSISQVGNTPGSKGADVATFATPSTDAGLAAMPAHQRPRAFNDMSWINEARHHTDIAALSRSVSVGRAIQEKDKRQKSLTGSAILHNRSKSTGRTSAIASAALLHDAPVTPRSRNRVADRRSLAHVNDATSLHTTGTRRTTGTRGTNSRGAAAARREAAEWRPVPTISVPSTHCM